MTQQLNEVQVFKNKVYDWWCDFDHDSEKRIEEFYTEWSECKDIELPSLAVVDDELNNYAISEKKFTEYFMKLYYNQQSKIKKDGE